MLNSNLYFLRIKRNAFIFILILFWVSEWLSLKQHWNTWVNDINLHFFILFFFHSFFWEWRVLSELVIAVTCSSSGGYTSIYYEYFLILVIIVLLFWFTTVVAALWFFPGYLDAESILLNAFSEWIFSLYYDNVLTVFS